MVEYSSTAKPHLDHTFLALADPTRRAILQRLTRGEARVTEIAQPFPQSLNAISKHIRILERAGLVLRRKVGRDHWIAAQAEPLADAEQWIAQQRAFWNARLDALEALLLEEDRNKKGPVR